MTRFGWLVVSLIALVLLGGIGGIAWLMSRDAAPAPASEQATTTPPVDPADLSIYTSGEYGFSFVYPSTARITDAFTASGTPPFPWRQQAVGTGTPIVAVAAGLGEARVGMATDLKARAACEKAGPAETRASPLAVGSTTWQRFSSQKIGTDDERSVTSYRALYDGRCYAVEVFAPLNGAAAAAAPSGYTIDDLITTFTFAPAP